MSKGQSCRGHLTEDFLGGWWGDTRLKSSSRWKSLSKGVLDKNKKIKKKRPALPMSSKHLTEFTLICFCFLKDTPSTTNGSGNTGEQASVSQGVHEQLPTPGAPRRPASPRLTFPASSSQTAPPRLGPERVSGEMTGRSSCVGLPFSFSPLPLPFCLLLCSSLSLSSPLLFSLNLLHCSWTSPWIKTLSKNPLFKVISNFSARLSEICLFEGRIRCDRRFIVT